MATDSPVSTLPKPEMLKEEQAQKFVLTLSCVERAGIVQAVTTFLFERGFNIEEHQQFDDGLRQTLHLRTAFSGPLSYSPERLEEEFRAIADRFEMKFSFHDQTKKRVLVMVSKFGHCLNDLIFRWRGGGSSAVTSLWLPPTMKPTAPWLKPLACPLSTFLSPRIPRRTLSSGSWTWWKSTT